MKIPPNGSSRRGVALLPLPETYPCRTSPTMAFGSCFLGVCLPMRGLASPPQAFFVSVSLAATSLRLSAALRSRSITRPHEAHLKIRSERSRCSLTSLHPEHFFDDG